MNNKEVRWILGLGRSASSTTSNTSVEEASWIPSGSSRQPTASGTIRPICLPFFDEELAPATQLWILCWGFTEQNGGKMSDTLLQASVHIIDHTRCNAEDAYQGEVTEKMLCAGVPGGGVDTCQGDTGGP
uniref:transmembrane protease serine 4-like n=1 Tax=Ictidomys tridecemlineatus TaxID=43179 RepID=UPI001A9F81A0|nr:transmembrane protease serine 4-like [Ictidomys tridecemlineatus]